MQNKMEKFGLVLFFAILMSSIAVCAVSTDMNASYEEMKAKSQSDGIASGADGYFKVIKNELKEMINAAFGRCVKRSFFSRPKLFDIVLKMNAEGRIESTATSENNDNSLCVRQYLLGKNLSKPPFAPFHLFVKVIPDQ